MAKTLENDQEQLMQKLMDDIISGARNKFVEPVLSENRKIGRLLDEMHEKDRREFETLRARIDRLEEAVLTTPLLLLNAIKEAISRAGMDDKS
ncbi:MAG: hypothetical protein ACOY31_07170 [Bacillota bacterium]